MNNFLIQTLFIRYWYPFVTAEYGNCFSFNSHYNKNDPDLFNSRQRLATLTGTSNGLTVEVFLDQKNYMLEKLSKKAGARLIIHDAYSSPLADEYGMDLQPNTASSVAIQQVKLFCIKLCSNRNRQMLKNILVIKNVMLQKLEPLKNIFILEQDHKDESPI